MYFMGTSFTPSRPNLSLLKFDLLFPCITHLCMLRERDNTRTNLLTLRKIIFSCTLGFQKCLFGKLNSSFRTDAGKIPNVWNSYKKDTRANDKFRWKIKALHLEQTELQITVDIAKLHAVLKRMMVNDECLHLNNNNK